MTHLPLRRIVISDFRRLKGSWDIPDRADPWS